MMRYIISTIGTLCLCLMGGLTPARAQIELPQQQGLTDVGHQKIQTLIITNDGTAISSLTPSAWTDDDRQKLVMWLSGNGFADIDADGTDGVYTDYIWIHPGSLSNGSITPDDIEGRLGVLDVLQDGMCTGNTTEGSLTGVRGFDSEGKPLCIQSTNPYWRGGGSVIYRDDANYSLPAIHIGCEDTDCPGDSDTMIAVDGATRIPGADAMVGFGEGNDRFIVNQNNIQLNTAGASTPIIIAKGGRVGVRQPDPRQALDVVGGLVAQDQRTISPSYGGSSAKGNSLVLSVDGDRTILSHPNTILLSKGQHSRLTQSGGSASANRAYASMRGGGSVAVRIYCPPVSSQCEIGVFGLQPTTLRIAHGSRTLITQGSAIEHRATVARSSLLPSQIDVTAAGVKRSITINRAGLPSSSDFAQVNGGGDVYHFASYERDAIRVAMGFDLSQGNFVGPIEKAANLTVQGPTTIKGGAESDLRMRNLRPSNPVYHTLEEVGCKLLTIDDDGHMQLVSYMPERCNGNAPAVPVDGVCGSSHGGTTETAPTNNLCAEGTPSTVSATANGWSWVCQGLNNGNDATCQSTKTPQQTTDGVCNPVLDNQTLFASWNRDDEVFKVTYNAVGQPDGNFVDIDACTSGSLSATPVRTYGSKDTPVSWRRTCEGSGGGKNATCSMNISCEPEKNDRCGMGGYCSGYKPEISGGCFNYNSLAVLECERMVCDGGSFGNPYGPGPRLEDSLGLDPSGASPSRGGPLGTDYLNPPFGHQPPTGGPSVMCPQDTSGGKDCHGSIGPDRSSDNCISYGGERMPGIPPQAGQCVSCGGGDCKVQKPVKVGVYASVNKGHTPRSCANGFPRELFTHRDGVGGVWNPDYRWRVCASDFTNSVLRKNDACLSWIPYFERSSCGDSDHTCIMNISLGTIDQFLECKRSKTMLLEYDLGRGKSRDISTVIDVSSDPQAVWVSVGGGPTIKNGYTEYVKTYFK